MHYFSYYSLSPRVEKGELNPGGGALLGPACVGEEDCWRGVGGVGSLQMLWYRRGLVAGGSGLVVWGQCRNDHRSIDCHVWWLTMLRLPGGVRHCGVFAVKS